MEIKRVEEGEGKAKVYLVFSRVGLNKVINVDLEELPMSNQVHSKPALTFIWLEVGFRTIKNTQVRKSILRNQLVKEKQIKMVFIMRKYVVSLTKKELRK